MRLFYLDPALAGNQGHHATVCQNIVAQAKARGIETQVFGYHVMPNDWIEKILAAPFFRTWPYILTNGDPYCGFMNAFFDAAGTLFEDLSRLPPMTSDDLIYLPVAQGGQLLGLAQWLSGFAPGTAPAAIADLVALPGFEPREDSGKRHWVPTEVTFDPRPTTYRFAGLRIRELNLPDLHLISQAPEFAEIYSHILLRDVYPMSTLPYDAPKPPTQRGQRAPLTVVLTGYQWERKGFQFAPEIFAGLLATHGHVKLIAHNSNPHLEKMPETRRALRELAASEPRVVYKECTLRESTYQTLLDDCDLLLCPYDPAFYQVNRSGVVSECLANAIPMVLPAGTLLAVDAEKYGAAATFSGFDAAAVLAATRHVLDDFESYSGRALEGARLWATQKGSTRFFEEILRLVARGGP